MASQLATQLASASAPTDGSPLAGIAVLLPALRPEAALTTLAVQLASAGFGHVVIVDDGSGPGYAHLFDPLRRLPRTTLLRHAATRGKGRALKTGIAHVLDALPWVRGVVTADADGQHRFADILRVAAALNLHRRTVLGTRRLAAGTPWRSRLGNATIHAAFHAVTGIPLADTQTGLRGLPLQLLPGLRTLPGERYEYEMRMLLHLCGAAPAAPIGLAMEPPIELSIETVYLAGNRGSHFRPLRDSAQVLAALLGPGLTARLASFRGAAPRSPTELSRPASSSGSRGTLLRQRPR